ncbi:hypothetical protein [Bradyrhizobium elkanii]|uniref:hypothetical protein n=1 Tax=Bradyrhizobium elkanii TaxID=29448 RepID=UPI0035166A2C
MTTKSFSASATPSHCSAVAAQHHCGAVAARHHCRSEDWSDLVYGEDAFIQMSNLAATSRRGSGHHCAPRHA